MIQRAQSFVNAVLLNRQTGESATPIMYAPIKGSTTVPTDFSPGVRVRNTKTGETGVVVDVACIYPNATPVIYDKEFEEWGTVWDTPTHSLELIP
jgi:hypothetical protein